MHPILASYIDLLATGKEMPISDRVTLINRLLFPSLISEFERICLRTPKGPELRAALEAGVKVAAAQAARSALYCARSFDRELERTPQERPFAAYGSVTIRQSEGRWQLTPYAFPQHVGLPATYQGDTLDEVISAMERDFRQADLLPALTPA